MPCELATAGDAAQLDELDAVRSGVRHRDLAQVAQRLGVLAIVADIGEEEQLEVDPPLRSQDQ